MVVHASHVSIAQVDEPQSPCISRIAPSSAAADVPLQTEPAVADVDCPFVQKLDARSGRLYWLDLSTGLTSWIPPSGCKMQSTNFQSDRATALENKNISADQVDNPHLSHPQMLQRRFSEKENNLTSRRNFASRVIRLAKGLSLFGTSLILQRYRHKTRRGQRDRYRTCSYTVYSA